MGGLCVLLITWLMAFNHTGMLAPLVYLLLVILFYILSAPFKWYVVLPVFLFSCYVSNATVDVLNEIYPTHDIYNDENFPRVNYFLAVTLVGALSKALLETILLLFIKPSQQKLPN